MFKRVVSLAYADSVTTYTISLVNWRYLEQRHLKLTYVSLTPLALADIASNMPVGCIPFLIAFVQKRSHRSDRFADSL